MQTLTTPVLPTLRSPRRPAMARHKALGLIGASLGVLVFLFVGLLPALLLGGNGGIQLAYALFGTGEAPTIGVSTFAILGVLTATTLGAALFAILGAAAGSAVGELNRSGATPTSR